MSVREYIGARYVPIFADPITWDNTRDYEPLTIVQYQGNSYTSRQYVPIGIDILNETFWALTGNYNAQIEQYRNEVLAFDDRITANADNINTITQDFGLLENTVDGVVSDLNNITADNWVTSNRIANNAITTDKIADDAITTDKIANDAIITDRIANNAITTNKIVDDAITTNKIADAAITADKISSGVTGIGNGYIAASVTEDKQAWLLYYSYDGVTFTPIKNLSSYMDLAGDDLCHIKRFEDWFYIISQHTYKTKDFNTFELVPASNKPANPYGAHRYWGYDIVNYNGQYYYIFCPAIDSSSETANAVGGTSYIFHVHYGTCSFDNETGLFTFDAPIILAQFGTSNNDTYIDPSIIYHESYGFVLAIKNEKTSRIEIWTGANIQSLVKRNDVGYFDIGFEAPKLINADNEIILYSHAYKGYYPLTITPFNTVQQLTKNGVFITNSLKTLLRTGATLRHIGVMKCDSAAYEVIKNFTCQSFIPDSRQYQVITFPTAAGSYDVPNVPMQVYVGGNVARTINIIERFNYHNHNTLMPIVTLTDSNPHLTIGTGFRNGLAGTEFPYTGNNHISSFIWLTPYLGCVCTL